MYDVRRGNKFLISLSLFIKGLRNKIKINKNNGFLNDLQNIEFFLNEFVCLYLKGGQCYCSPIILIKNSSMQTTKGGWLV